MLIMRSSVYLTDKALSLYQAIKFFNQKNNTRLIFLAQIDFWDFEIDALRFSFESFNERTKIWDQQEDIDKFLYKKYNFIAKQKIINKIVEDRVYQKRIHKYRKHPLKNEVESPEKALEKCNEEWNDLVDKCQDLLISEKFSKTLEHCGVKNECDLSKYKKTINNKA